ncbi:tRNA dihydrouridine(20/20a) synthase DusA [Gammaproteobacteria bacterium]|uniref:tRNA-dihydrouridine(20/20a) synthase n=1 Tax=OM182 bacterium MED-G28 TaxID=1986256 RepID=A0A2A5WFW3_9GAMM|nr:tRNA dihydrouridine(20/20a) synthase DusA [Gammaproteobacteria bacterium]MDC0221758.1 tRNA dihydrouridine(20/20a) synthase DusA [Gammaproteobacteria bacterium]PDH35158.1 MAG: tRNA dihydrouridine(20/20a) synthase DusA [OM182 bacterium MED-G28]
MHKHKFCIAPMMDWTDRHDRVFLRQFTKHALLYTEMVTSAALEHGDANYLLQHHADENPVALQIGGSDPIELARAAKLGEKAGFDEINLNVGCPSERVQSGSFGACLMTDPPLVRDCVSKMMEAVTVPVTVKCRIGVDDRDSEEDLMDFVNTVATAGCNLFIIHARKAILSGLSPKENREIPPLNYERVFAIKKAFPKLEIIINGGITNIDEVDQFLLKVDGVMLGREAYKNPYLLDQVDRRLFQEKKNNKSRIDYLEEYFPYMESELAKGTPLIHMTRHILGLFKGQKGGKLYRRHLSENAYRENAGLEVVKDAITYVY